MFISIIVPVYNVSPYIARCLQSVIDQAFTGEMECIIVDDCSQDDSIELAQQVIDRYQGDIQFRIVKHDHNRGLSAARNTGIDASQGDYLFFLDSDDWLVPHCIASMSALTEAHPGVELVQAGALSHGGEAKPWLNMENSVLPEYIQGKETVKPIMLNRKQIPVTAWNRLVKKDFLLRHHLYFQEGLIHEDELWTFNLSSHLSSLAILKQNVYHYEYHESGIMATASTQKSASLIAIVCQMINGIDDSCQALTVSYITDFIHLRSFDIPEEPYRLTFLESLPALYPYFSLARRLNARLWHALSKLPIRKHYWLYTLLYHWKV